MIRPGGKSSDGGGSGRDVCGDGLYSRCLSKMREVRISNDWAFEMKLGPERGAGARQNAKNCIL